MTIIDAQLHEPSVLLGWEGADDALRRDVLVEAQLVQMQAVGVDKAVLFPADVGWAEYAAARHPDRFTFVPMIGDIRFGGIDPERPDIADLIALNSTLLGIAGMRVVRYMPPLPPLDIFRPAIEACERHGLPLFLTVTDDLATAAQVASEYPDLLIVVDHLGVRSLPDSDPESHASREFAQLIALARFPNVAVKFSAAPLMSKSGYPFEDLWPHLERVVEAYRPERLMWGSDASRFTGRIGFSVQLPGTDVPGYRPNHTYAEALLYIRETSHLSATDKEWMLGRTAASLLTWPS